LPKNRAEIRVTFAFCNFLLNKNKYDPGYSSKRRTENVGHRQHSAVLAAAREDSRYAVAFPMGGGNLCVGAHIGLACLF